MKKFTAIILSAVIILSLFAGCVKGESPETQENTVRVEETKEGFFNHSNLTDEESLSEVTCLLERAGVSEERINVLKKSIDFFNSCVDKTVLTKGFEETDFSEEFYDPYALQDMWYEKSPDFNGYNCRITAFSLFDDFIDISESAEIRDSELFMDIESLEAKNDALINDNDMDRFRAFFSVIPTEDTKDISVHANKIKEDFKNRGISFKENENMSLITLWQHNQWSEDENELFVGHAGVLLRCSGGYVFLEKIAFQEPYQAIKFTSKSQLNDYLMKKYNVSWGQPTADPFVMENGELLVKE